MPKVLYIEDDKEQIDLYAFAFKTYAPDLEFIGERYPQEALDKIKEIKPDIILLDIIMPDMDGVMVLKKLKALPEAKDIPVIVFTNSAQPGLSDVCMKLGALKFWQKTDILPKDIVKNLKIILSKNY